MIIHHFFRWCFFWLSIIFFPIFQEKNQTYEQLHGSHFGGFPSEVDPWGVASRQEPFHCRGVTAPSSRGAEKTWKNQMKKTIGLLKDMERKNDFFLPQSHVLSWWIMIYCTTVLLYHYYICVQAICYIKTCKQLDSPAIFVRNFANRPIVHRIPGVNRSQ